MTETTNGGPDSPHSPRANNIAAVLRQVSLDVQRFSDVPDSEVYPILLNSRVVIFLFKKSRK